MIPGRFSKMSECTAASTTTVSGLQGELVYVTGTTNIATIKPPRTGGFNSFLVIVPTDGNVALLTTGNIAVAVTMPQNRATVLVWSDKNSTWYPGAIS